MVNSTDNYVMNTVIYDSRRIFWPQNTPANGIPIKIDSPGEISGVTNVQDAIQMLTDDISCTIGKLPKDLDRDEDTLRNTIDCVNLILEALRHLRRDNKNHGGNG